MARREMVQVFMKANGKSAGTQPRDFVDHLVEQWQREQPRLDTTVAAIVVRMKRATAIFDDARERLAQRVGLHGNELMLLDALRRSGPPYRLKPGVLMRELLIASGTATRWIDSIEDRRLVKRLADPNDRRGILIALTPLGRRVLQKTQSAHGLRGNRSPEHWALSRLGRAELETLSNLLRKALLMLEGEAGPPAACAAAMDANGSGRGANRRNVRVPRRCARGSGGAADTAERP